MPDNIILLRLPPNASELNRIKNTWEYLCGNALSMTVWESYTAIVNACCNASNGQTNDAERIAFLTIRNRAQIKT